MTFETYLNLLESQLKDLHLPSLKDGQMLSNDLDLYNIQQQHLCKKDLVELLQRKYYALKLLIYRCNVDLSMEVPEFIIRDYGIIH